MEQRKSRSRSSKNTIQSFTTLEQDRYRRSLKTDSTQTFFSNTTLALSSTRLLYKDRPQSCKRRDLRKTVYCASLQTEAHCATVRSERLQV